MSAQKKTSLVIKEIPANSTWALRQRILWPNKPINYVKLPNDEDGVHFGLYQKEQLIAVGSLFISGVEAQFRKLATLPSEQGKGYGTQLLSHLTLYCRNLGVERLWCNARYSKKDFYLNRGMICTNETFSKDEIVYVVMEKDLRQMIG